MPITKLVIKTVVKKVAKKAVREAAITATKAAAKAFIGEIQKQKAIKNKSGDPAPKEKNDNPNQSPTP